ncbi:MAG: hypothetical protein DWQ10_17105, partial [Calditrichaeota bacterium]
MNSPIKIDLLQNALDSLQRVKRGLNEIKVGDELAMKDVLAWSWHCIDLLANSRLQPARHNFDSWMQDFLRDSEHTMLVERDIHWSDSAHLNILELLDIFSPVHSSILKPEFYQGWQDRTSRCHNLREEVAKIVGRSLDDDLRDQLMVLLAAYNRLVHVPATVQIEQDKIKAALPAFFDFIAMLIKPGDEGANSL